MKKNYVAPSMKVYKISQVSALMATSGLTIDFGGSNTLTGAPHTAEVNGETGLWDDLEGE